MLKSLKWNDFTADKKLINISTPKEREKKMLMLTMAHQNESLIFLVAVLKMITVHLFNRLGLYSFLMQLLKWLCSSLWKQWWWNSIWNLWNELRCPGICCVCSVLSPVFVEYIMACYRFKHCNFMAAMSLKCLCDYEEKVKVGLHWMCNFMLR